VCSAGFDAAAGPQQDCERSFDVLLANIRATRRMPPVSIVDVAAAGGLTAGAEGPAHPRV